MARILVVGRDRELVALIRFACERVGHAVTVREDGPSALALTQQLTPDLTIMESTRPDGHDVTLTQQLRAVSLRPMIMLTLRRSDAQQIAYFDAGADDCVSLPCNMTVLLQRVQAHLRRASRPVPAIVSADLGEAHINFDTNHLTGAHGNVRLTPTEGRILYHLLAAQGQPLATRTLATRLWGPYAGGGSALKSHVCHLRRKLRAAGGDSAGVEMVARVGYQLRQPT